MSRHSPLTPAELQELKELTQKLAKEGKIRENPDANKSERNQR